MIKIDVILGVAAAAITLTAFFARAWSNYRSGTRVKRYTGDIRKHADAEYERLKAELDAAERALERKRGSPEEK